MTAKRNCLDVNDPSSANEAALYQLTWCQKLVKADWDEENILECVSVRLMCQQETTYSETTQMPMSPGRKATRSVLYFHTASVSQASSLLLPSSPYGGQDMVRMATVTQISMCPWEQKVAGAFTYLTSSGFTCSESRVLLRYMLKLELYYYTHVPCTQLV